jgi:hypothetical protein
MSSQPRFCEHCGAPILPQARFCENCGHPIVAVAPAPPVEDSAPTRQVPKTPATPAPVRKAPIVPILLVGLGLAAVAVAFMALRKPAKPAGDVLTPAVAVVATPVPAPALPTPVPPSGTAPDALTDAAAQAAAAARRPSPPRPRPTPPIVATYQCRVGVKFDVEPEEAEIAVDGRSIGTVEDLDGEPYIFERPGSYYVRIERVGYRTLWVKVVCRAEADEDYYEIDRELEELED